MSLRNVTQLAAQLAERLKSFQDGIGSLGLTPATGAELAEGLRRLAPPPPVAEVLEGLWRLAPPAQEARPAQPAGQPVPQAPLPVQEAPVPPPESPLLAGQAPQPAGPAVAQAPAPAGPAVAKAPPPASQAAARPAAPQVAPPPRPEMQPPPPALPAGKTAARTPKPRKKRVSGDWVEKALCWLRAYPSWSDSQIARQIGATRSTLSKNAKYRQAARAIRKQHCGTPRRGFKIGDSLEVIDTTNETSELF